MPDEVRRVTVYPWGGVDCAEDTPDGDHALLPWPEYESLRSVLDAVRIAIDKWWMHEGMPAAMLDLVNAIRAHDAKREAPDVG